MTSLAARKMSANPKTGAPMPVMAARIAQAALREDVNVSELADLAALDPALAVRLLAVVNSPVYGMRGRVSDVRHAIGMIGARGLQNVALSLMVSDLVPDSPEANLLLVQSLRRAEACRSLAEKLKLPDADACFSTGLLLEIGVLSRAKESLGASLAAATQAPEHRVIFEHAGGFEPHPSVGATMARGYGLPETTAEAIAHHHDAEPPTAMHARVAWVAERLAGAYECGAVAKAKQRALEAGGQLGLSSEVTLTILEALPKRVEELGAAFQRDFGPQMDLEQLRDDASARLVEMNLQYEQTIRALEQVLREKDTLTEQLKVLNQELAQQATTDALTGLPNRRAMTSALERDLLRVDREGKPLAFVLLDVDHFKRFNDTYGHGLGDEVLRGVGRVLMAGARKGDLPARYGGEEFAIVLPSADVQGAALAARRFRVAIERATVDSPAGPLRVTASFGVAAAVPGRPLPSVAELIQRADEALYRAKAAGRNQVVTAE